MERPTGVETREPFTSPQEEIAYLREEIAKKERDLARSNEGPSREEIVSEEVVSYRDEASSKVLRPDYEMTVAQIQERVLSFTPEHDAKIDELVSIMEQRGIKNALSVSASLNNPHIEDDFHRFLVQYLLEFGDIAGVKEGTPLFKALRMKLFEVTLLTKTPDGVERSFSDLVRAMEQFYAGMISLGKREGIPTPGEEYFTLELAQAQGSDEVVFYCAVPRSKERLFEKQLLAVFPHARVTPHREDYNPFNDMGVTVASFGRLTESPLLPIKGYDSFEGDPLAVILKAFSRLSKEREGAAIQLVISPVGSLYTKRHLAAIEKVRKGESLKEATESMGSTVAKETGRALKGLIFGYGDGADDEKEEVDPVLLENLQEKASAPLFEVNLRIVASAETKDEAETILAEIESSFNQFNKPEGNSIAFSHVLPKGLPEILHDFSFRLYQSAQGMALSSKELTSLLHFPVVDLPASDLKEQKGKKAPAPSGVARGEVVLGVNNYQGQEKEVRFGREDRVRHFYVIGQTGTGKTTLLKNMITQDIANGDGVCMIDPHGTDIVDVLANIPEHRRDDVIYFDPAYTARPMALNMLEYDPAFPEQKTFVVNELFSIFQKLYGGTPESMGPLFEQYFRNATMLVIEDPSTGNTLLDVSRVMSDAQYRELKLSRCSNPVVVQFWKKIAGEAGGEASLANIVPYITSKFDVFVANDIMRPIIAQEHSVLNMRKIMDEKKILLVNLSKGRLGDINANLIGLILVGKILMAALSRVDAAADQRPDFYLYIDEFQNITTPSIATILSEARKYRLGLTIAHQFIAQLDEGTRDAVFGNVGSLAAFRVGAEDAQFLESQFAPTFEASDIMNIENRNAYLKLLVDGQPNDPFNIATMAPSAGNPEVVEALKQQSYLRYGRDRAEIETEVRSKFKNL